MKRLIIVIFILVLLSVAFFILSDNGVSYDSSEDITMISPYSEHLYYLTTLYFVDENYLISEKRNVKIEKLEAELAVVQELKKHSEMQENRNPINDQTNIISVLTSDRVCYVNLSSGFIENELDEVIYINTMAIVNTLTEFDFVDRVQILIDGKKIQIESYSDQFSGPISRNRELIHLGESTPKSITKKFLDSIAKGRYDIAYEMIDYESKVYLNYDDFREEALVIREELKNYSRDYSFIKNDGNGIFITIIYLKTDWFDNGDSTLDASGENQVEKKFFWQVIKEIETWKIKYVPFN